MGARNLLALVALLWTTAVAAQTSPPFVVICHPDSTRDALSHEEVARVFLKKSIKWPDGTAALPVDLPLSHNVRVAFSQRVLGKAPRSVLSFWQQRIYSGLAVPPPTRDTEAEVMTFVRSHPGAIGYVGAGVKLDGVKAVKLAP